MNSDHPGADLDELARCLCSGARGLICLESRRRRKKKKEKALILTFGHFGTSVKAVVPFLLTTEVRKVWHAPFGWLFPMSPLGQNMFCLGHWF